MGLTDRRKTPKNLVDNRKNGKILTVSRKQGKKELTVKKWFPKVVNFKEGAKLTYGCLIYFPATFDSVRTLGQAPFSRALDIGSISAALSGNYFFSIAKIFLLKIKIQSFAFIKNTGHGNFCYWPFSHKSQK